MTDVKKQKVLIVDDDKFLLNMYSIKFGKSGFDVEVAIGGQDALNKIKEGSKPDVLLLDMVMPVMDGLEFLTRIRKENLIPDATVIILSNQNQPDEMEKAKSLGVASYIVKASSIPSEVVAEVLKVVSGISNNKS